MSLAAITELLERRTGLDAASLGASILPAAVAEHMREVGSADESAYAELLGVRADLLQTLTDRLAVPESWFFRGGELFSFLAREIANAVAGKRCYRVLSLPCSTGEEPYSMAMPLLDAGVPAASWRIEGIDLSARAIHNARRGVFREFSFRQTPREMKEKYFCTVDGGSRIDDTVRSSVEFRLGNLLEPAAWNGASSRYDLVFCRNLLIYFTPAARLRAVTELERLVTPGGLLAVGHAEPQILAGRPFRRFGPDGCFLFRQESGPSVGQTFWSAANVRGIPGEQPKGDRAAVRQPLFSATQIQDMCRQECRPHVAPSLADVRQLADAGRLDEALARCKAHLDKDGPSADAFCLLGIVLQARGATAEADDAFRKALYLDPEHREALMHSMLLLSRRGETSRAAALRERLARLQPEGES